MVKCFIGTSGWAYDHWNDIFYPEDLKEKDKFTFYTHRFETVELIT